MHEAEQYDRMGHYEWRKDTKVSGAVYTDFPPELMQLQRRVRLRQIGCCTNEV